MLHDGEEVALRVCVHRQVAQHAEDLLGLRKLHPDVLEPVEQFLKVGLSVLVKDVQVSGEVMQLNLTEALQEGEGRGEEEGEGRRMRRERRRGGGGAGEGRWEGKARGGGGGGGGSEKGREG